MSWSLMDFMLQIEPRDRVQVCSRFVPLDDIGRHSQIEGSCAGYNLVILRVVFMDSLLTLPIS